MPEVTIDDEFRREVPPLSADEYAGLEQDIIASSGPRDALKLWNGTLLDGHNRYDIATKHGLPYQVAEVGRPDWTREDAFIFIWDCALKRRNLAPYGMAEGVIRQEKHLRAKLEALARANQAAAGGDHGNQYTGGKVALPQISAEAANEPDDVADDVADVAPFEGEPAAPVIHMPGPKPWQSPRPTSAPVMGRPIEVQPQAVARPVIVPISTRDEIAKKAGMSHDTYKKAALIDERADEATKAKLRAGATTINREYTAILEAERQAQMAKIKAEMPAAEATGRYGTIVIDPPWDMQKIARDVAPDQAGFDYPTMTEDELAAFPVPDMMADDCHVFCWTTQKYLPVTLRLFDTWGLKYVLTMVWHKNGGFQPFGLPQYNCEFAVYGRKGTPRFTDLKAFPCCFSADRREHSRKPDEFYDIIRRVTEDGRIDVFSREARDGFAQFGNEADKFTVAAE